MTDIGRDTEDHGPPDLVRFGSTDLFVARYCQGTAFYELGRSANNPEGQRVLEYCLDVGVNFFDSSNGYGWGGSEVTLGKAVAGRRDKAVICDKLAPHYPPKTEDGEPEKTRYTREFVLEQTEKALQRLGTDYIDIFMLHHPVEDGSYEEMADVMDTVVQSGKARYWGVSNNTAAQVGKFLETSTRTGKAAVVGLENYYNIANTGVEELFPLLREAGLGILTFRPHQGGNPVSRGAAGEPDTPGGTLLQELRRVSAELGKPVPQVCVAWVLSHPEITSVLSCAESTEHVDDNLAATSLELPPEALSALNDASHVYREQSAEQDQSEG